MSLLTTSRDTIENIKKFLTWMVSQNGRPDGMTWPQIADKFNIKDTGAGQYGGDRARKTWSAFKESGKSVDDYVYQRFELKRRNQNGLDEPVTEEYKKIVHENGVTYYDVALESVHTEDDAYREFQIDRDRFVIQKFKLSQWQQFSNTNGKQTLAAVKFEVHPFEKVHGYTIEQYRERIEKMKADLTKLQPKKYKGSGVGVAAIADLHIGAYVRNVVATDNYDTTVVMQRLATAAEKINSHKFESVHLVFLGDIIHSFSGYNHPDMPFTMQDGMRHGEIIKEAVNILGKFIASVNNVSKIYIVGGNHDRIPADKNYENNGEGAYLIGMMLEHKFETIEIVCKDIVFTTIDNINYIFTHGHKPYAKKSVVDIAWQFGADPNKYVAMLIGHTHTRGNTQKVDRVGTQMVVEDSKNYCKRIVSSIYTGDKFSEGLWKFTNPGFLIMRNGGNDKPDAYDLTV